jgi:hypothetical protein
MSFFTLSDNANLVPSDEMEMGGDIAPIPTDTQVKAAIEQALWYTPKNGGDTVISITWSILAPKEYNARKIFQKLKVKDSDPKKRDKAIKMLAAIDKNAGGKLFAKGTEPTDNDLMQHLLSAPMTLLLKVWAMDDLVTGETKKGNWIAAVSPSNKVATPKPAETNFDDDIPF